MGVKVTLKPHDLGKFEKALASKMGPERLKFAFEVAGNQCVAMLRQRSALINGATDPGYNESWYAKVSGRSLKVGNAAKHAIWVELGRRPGKMPPSSALEDWVLSKGMAVTAAFPVARLIGQRGIAPRPVFTLMATQYEMVAIVLDALDRYVTRAFQGSL